MRSPALLLAAGIATVIIPLRLPAADRYWDINGATAGAGGPIASGVWDFETANWTLSSAGTSAPILWDPFDRAVFAAGTDATGAYQVAIPSNLTASGILIEEGTVVLSTGNVAVGQENITINTGGALSINSSTRITGSTLTLNGGTIISTNPVNALAFIPSAMNLEIGANGGTVSYSPPAGTAAISIYGGATGTILGTGTLIKTGAGEFRYQGAGLPNTTYTKLDVRQGLFRLGFNQSISDERGFGAVPAVFTPDAITLSGGGTIATSFLAVDSVLHVNRGITLGAGGGQLLGPITVPGAITGSGSLTTTTSTVVLTGSNDYTGATILNPGTLTLGTSAVATGGLLNTSGITLNNVSTLSLINSVGNADRIGNAVPVTMNAGANLSLVPNATTDTTEILGALTLASGTPTVTVTSAVDRVTTLTAATLTRTNHATALLRGTNLGQTVPTDVSRITLADSGASLTLVGTNVLNNGAANDATPALKIVPYLFGDSSATGTGNGFVTYDAALGFRVLTASQVTPLTPEYVTAANPDNVSVAADTTLTSASGVSVNSLLFKTATGTLTSSTPIPLTVQSGAVATSENFAYAVGAGFSELVLGNGEGVVTVPVNTLTINTPIRVTNDGGLTKSGVGTLALTAASSYTGGTRINAGVVQMNVAGAIGTGPVTVNGARLAINGAFTLSNAFTLGPNAGVAGNGLIQATNGIATVSGPINITHNASAGGHLAATGTNTLVISGLITAAPGVTITSRIGNIVLSGGGTGYTAYQIQAGKLSPGADNGIATTAVVDVASSDPGTLDLNGFNQTLAGIARTSGTAGRNALVTNSGAAKTLTLDVPGIVSYAGTAAAANVTGEAVISGALSIVKNGAGFQSFSGAGANTYTGSTTVNNGILKLHKATNVDVIPPGNSVTINAGGTLQLGADSQINDNITSLTIAGGTFDLATFVEGVTPAVTLSNATIAGSNATGFLLARGGYNGTGTNTITKSISVRGEDANSGLFNITAGTTSVSGNIRTDNGTTQGLTKTGAGTLVLSGASTYSGTTTAQAGALLVSGSLSAVSPVAVGDLSNLASQAILGGSGTVGDVTATGSGSAATSGAMIDPGNAPNIAGILGTGALSIGAGAHLSLQVGGSSAGGESPSGYDRVVASGLVNLTGGDLQLSLIGTPSFTLGDTLFLVVNNSFVSTFGTFATLNGSAFNPDNFTVAGQQFRLSYSANFSGGDFSDGVANDLAVIAVPEPSTWMVLLAGGAMAWSRRRRIAKA